MSIRTKPTTSRYSPDSGITISGSPIDGTLKKGKKSFVLGFFSMNLRRVLDATKDAHSEEEAAFVPDAVEFFVFGLPQESAVSSHECEPEEEGNQ